MFQMELRSIRFDTRAQRARGQLPVEHRFGSAEQPSQSWWKRVYSTELWVIGEMEARQKQLNTVQV